VRPYRLLSDAEELIPLREPSPLTEVRHLAARRGIVGHVVTTGRAYVAGDLGQGELVRKLAEESEDRAAWCFAVKHGTARLGAVVVGELAVSPHQNGALLHAMERLTTRLWCELEEVNKGRTAALDDPVSHLYSREAFLRAAESSLQESYNQAEPVALGVIALEGLRELNDTGRWEIADELVGDLAQSLRRKVRLDDCLGRFDGSRFMVLLRRVDSELASLIIGQIMSRLSAVCDDQARWRAAVRVRCGVAGSGTDQPELRSLMARALAECRRAREEGTAVACDLGGVKLESGVRI
jgi:diguanylate cyclase (GGDEF)-like protein